MFAFDERESWEAPPSGFDFADIDPARFKRRLSHLARPLLRSQQRYVTWGPRHVMRSLTHMLGMSVLGRLPHGHLRSKLMLAYWGEARNEIGKRFEGQVFDSLRTAGRFVLHRALGIGPTRRFRNVVELGDFDIVACDLERAVLFALECKATDFGRSPGEISQEADSLLRGDRQKSASISRVDAHQRRLAWLEANACCRPRT